MKAEINKKIMDMINNTANGISIAFKGKRISYLSFFEEKIFFELFDFLFQDNNFINYLYLIDNKLSKNHFDCKTKKDIQDELSLMFKLNYLSKLNFLKLLFLCIKKRCFIECEFNDEKTKNALKKLKLCIKG